MARIGLGLGLGLWSSCFERNTLANIFAYRHRAAKVYERDESSLERELPQ